MPVKFFLKGFLLFVLMILFMGMAFVAVLFLHGIPLGWLNSIATEKIRPSGIHFNFENGHLKADRGSGLSLRIDKLSASDPGRTPSVTVSAFTVNWSFTSLLSGNILPQLISVEKPQLQPYLNEQNQLILLRAFTVESPPPADTDDQKIIMALPDWILPHPDIPLRITITEALVQIPQELSTLGTELQLQLNTLVEISRLSDKIMAAVSTDVQSSSISSPIVDWDADLQYNLTSGDWQLSFEFLNDFTALIDFHTLMPFHPDRGQLTGSGSLSGNLLSGNLSELDCLLHLKNVQITDAPKQITAQLDSFKIQLRNTKANSASTLPRNFVVNIESASSVIKAPAFLQRDFEIQPFQITIQLASDLQNVEVSPFAFSAGPLHLLAEGTRWSASGDGMSGHGSLKLTGFTFEDLVHLLHPQTLANLPLQNINLNELALSDFILGWDINRSPGDPLKISATISGGIENKNNDALSFSVQTHLNASDNSWNSSLILDQWIPANWQSILPQTADLPRLNAPLHIELNASGNGPDHIHEIRWNISSASGSLIPGMTLDEWLCLPLPFDAFSFTGRIHNQLQSLDIDELKLTSGQAIFHLQHARLFNPLQQINTIQPLTSASLQLHLSNWFVSDFIQYIQPDKAQEWGLYNEDLQGLAMQQLDLVIDATADVSTPEQIQIHHLHGGKQATLLIGGQTVVFDYTLGLNSLRDQLLATLHSRPIHIQQLQLSALSALPVPISSLVFPIEISAELHLPTTISANIIDHATARFAITAGPGKLLPVAPFTDELQLHRFNININLYPHQKLIHDSSVVLHIDDLRINLDNLNLQADPQLTSLQADFDLSLHNFSIGQWTQKIDKKLWHEPIPPEWQPEQLTGVINIDSLHANVHLPLDGSADISCVRELVFSGNLSDLHASFKDNPNLKEIRTDASFQVQNSDMHAVLHVSLPEATFEQYLQGSPQILLHIDTSAASSQIRADVDLTQTGIHIPPINWNKAIGQSADITLNITAPVNLQNLATTRELQFDLSANSLLFERTEMSARAFNTQPDKNGIQFLNHIIFDSFNIDQTTFTAEILLPAENTYVATIQGDYLDLPGLMSKFSIVQTDHAVASPEPKTTPAPATPATTTLPNLNATASFNTIALSENFHLHDFTFQTSVLDNRLHQSAASFQYGKDSFNFTLKAAAGKTSMDWVLNVSDLGSLAKYLTAPVPSLQPPDPRLQNLQNYASLFSGGSLSISGILDGNLQSPVIDCSVALQNVVLHKELPFLSKITALSKEARSPVINIPFSHLKWDNIRFDSGIMRMQTGSIDGPVDLIFDYVLIDLNRQTLNLRGSGLKICFEVTGNLSSPDFYLCRGRVIDLLTTQGDEFVWE